jgi:hypothetical protein
MSEPSVGLADRSQYALISLIQTFWQFLENSPDTWWETLAENFQLAKHPSEPFMIM